MDLITSLNWRYATKKYNDKKVPADKVEKILEAISLSASSFGIQPYRVLVVENQEVRKQLGEGSFNTQIAEASHLLVFAAFEKITQQDIDAYLAYVAKVRSFPIENLADFKSALVNTLLARTDEHNFQWSSKQAYIGLGTGLIAAADLQIDATPMEGFDNEKFDRLLGLSDKGLKSVVLLALGYRDEGKDYLAKLKKARLPQEEFVTKIR
jgi:nitroreductase / dihydropteridine reductase